jgi:hypothetical protein
MESQPQNFMSGIPTPDQVMMIQPPESHLIQHIRSE